MLEKSDTEPILDNSFRRLTKIYYEKFFRYWSEKIWYYDLHNFYVFLLSFIMLFSNNLIILTSILAIVTLDAFSVIALHECPLTTLERKYLKRTSWKDRNKILKSLNLSFKCNHMYESQLELLINVWMLISSKMLIIGFFRMFNITLFNDYGIYK
jgi:hypothetical protein